MYGAVDLPNVGKFATVFSQFFGLYCRHEIVILSERQISLLGENYNGKGMFQFLIGKVQQKESDDVTENEANEFQFLIGKVQLN